MPTVPGFVEARSVEEALGVLHRYQDEAKVVAGGTAITIMLRSRLIAPRVLVSIARLEELGGIAVAGDLSLGALATHREVERSAIVREALPVVSDTFGSVGNVRVRHAATVGGVVAEADYASDPPSMLTALDARVHVIGPAGARTVPMVDFQVGFFETVLAPDEIVTSVSVPLLPARSGAAYEKYVTRSSEDRPCVGVAAVVTLSEDGTCADLRVAVGAVTEVPARHREIEVRAQGSELTDAVIGGIAEAYADSVDPISDVRGSAWYRAEMVRVWVRRAIHEAHQRAVQGAPAAASRSS
jgi:carbon-monoxide dehydrogenase medium subunit